MRQKTLKLLVLGSLLSALLLTTTSIGAQAKTTVHYKEVHYEFTGDYSPVGDLADGHFFGSWTRKGLSLFETGEVAAYSAIGYFDAIKGSGVISGYDTTTFEDGSSWSTRFTGQFSVGAKGLWVIPHKGEFIRGTGRFAGIQGTLVYTSRQINSSKDFAGFAETEGMATYTLGK